VVAILTTSTQPVLYVKLEEGFMSTINPRIVENTYEPLAGHKGEVTQTVKNTVQGRKREEDKANWKFA
jgi:hypothetical protein